MPRRRIRKIATLDAGLRQQPLPNVPVLIGHTPDRPDRIAGLAVLNLAPPTQIG
jgi:hypothetical protein